MKSLLKSGLLIIAFMGFFFTNSYAQNIIKENRSISKFNTIDISSAFDVELTQGNTESLVIEADEDIIENIYSEVIHGTLKIYTKSHLWRDHEHKYHKMKAYISFIDIEELELSGAVNISGMNKMKFDNLIFDLSGACKIELDYMADHVHLDMSGASKLYFTGTANEFEIDVSGASLIEALDFETKNCDIDAAGASSIKIFVTDELTADISGATRVRYKGNPSVNIGTSGVSSVKRY